jgi:hypothetical protein
MLYTICGWYTFIMLILESILTIAKDGVVTTQYTGSLKLTKILLNLPIIYFVARTLFH